MKTIHSITCLLATLSLAASAADAPEKTLDALLKQTAGKALEVEGIIVAAKTLKVKGLVHGLDSDLTVTTQEGVPGRTIILKGKSWTSLDDTHWEPAEEIDRSFPKLVMSPLIYNGHPSPPFEEVNRRTQKDGSVLQHIRLKVPEEDESTDRPNYWITWSEDKAVAIVRAEVPVLMGGHTITIKADYHLASAGTVVKAPTATGKKTTDASPQPAPEILLAAAKRNMTHHAAWKFSASVQARQEMKLSGILEGQNCDLTLAGDGDDGFRQKLVGKVQHSSTDGGKTWEQSEVERDLFHLVNTPVRSRADEKIPPFEIVSSKEVAEGITILHIRFKSPEVVQEEGDRPNYWLVLTDGKPSAVLRYHGPMGFQGKYVTGRVDYEPADLHEDGSPLVEAPARL